MEKQREVWNRLYASSLEWHFENKLPEIFKNKSVLELGVGSGKTLKSILKQKPKQVNALDFSKEAIERIRIKDKNLKISIGDAKSLPFYDNSFDVVVCFYVLNNSNEEERKKIVSEINRVLKKNGRILFEDFLEGDLRMMQGGLVKKEKNSFIRKDGLFIHFFEKKEVKELFSDFEAVKIESEESKPFRKLKLKRKIMRAEFVKKIENIKF